MSLQRPTREAAASAEEYGAERRAGFRAEVAGGPIAGLDGIRGLAVIFVLAYHCFAGIPGGFIGVDVFFVVSGFLITRWWLERRWSLATVGVFYLRRARRLLPALAVMLLVCVAVAGVVGRDTVVGIRDEVIGAVTLSYNWVAVADESDYFAGSAPRLFQNLWSLAVEEQFYVVWPLVLAVILSVCARRGVRLVVVLTLAAVSAGLMSVWFFAAGGPSRAYFGTDTHSFGLLCGSALAIWRHAFPPIGVPGDRWRGWRLAAALGCVGVLVIGAGVIDETAGWVFNGGLFCVSVVTAVLIALISGDAWVGRRFDFRPLRFVGQRSYGLYLWHWPILVLLVSLVPAARDKASAAGIVVGCVAVGLSVAFSVVSYRYVERPVMKDGFVGFVRGVRRRVRAGRSPLVVGGACWSMFALVGLAACGAVVNAPLQSAGEIAVERGLEALRGDRSESRELPVASAAPLPTPVDGSGLSPEVVEPAPGVPAGTEVTAIGDSVMLAAVPELQERFAGIAIDAVVSRQVLDGVAVVADLVASGSLRPVVVVGLGTNGDVRDSVFQEIVDLAGPSRKVVFVAVAGSVEWATTVNERLHRIADANSNVSVADWPAAVVGVMDGFASDGIHPTTSGARAYASALEAALIG